MFIYRFPLKHSENKIIIGRIFFFLSRKRKGNSDAVCMLHLTQSVILLLQTMAFMRSVTDMHRHITFPLMSKRIAKKLLNG